MFGRYSEMLESADHGWRVHISASLTNPTPRLSSLLSSETVRRVNGIYGFLVYNLIRVEPCYIYCAIQTKACI